MLCTFLIYNKVCSPTSAPHPPHFRGACTLWRRRVAALRLFTISQRVHPPEGFYDIGNSKGIPYIIKKESRIYLPSLPFDGFPVSFSAPETSFGSPKALYRKRMEAYCHTPILCILSISNDQHNDILLTVIIHFYTMRIPQGDLERTA